MNYPRLKRQDPKRSRLRLNSQHRRGHLSAPYDKIANLYDFLLLPIEVLIIEKVRRKTVPKAVGLVLDLASGTGNNLKFYSTKTTVVLTDLSINMLKKAKKKNRKFNKNALFVCCNLEKLPFKEITFDQIVSVDVICSLKHPQKSLREVLRVMKYGGKALFAEHGTTQSKIQNMILKVLNAITKRLGSDLLRKPEEIIKEAGFHIEKVHYLPGTFRLIEAQKPSHIVNNG